MKKTIIISGVILFLVGGFQILDNMLFDGIRPQVVQEDGVRAKLYAGKETTHATTIVVVGGGQFGDYWSEYLAKQGYVGLSLPYVQQEGLPDLPEEIPLVYFENALTWLIHQPQVDPQKIIVMGASKNSELALILGAVFPNYISGVVAYAPTSVSWSNTVLPYNSDEIKASWTYKNEDIPYVPMNKIKGKDTGILNTIDYWKNGLALPEAQEKAVIKVENIRGPILLFSGKSDEVWPSAIMANAIEKRLKNYDFTYSVQNIQFENAGHLISRNPDSVDDTKERRTTMTIGGIDSEISFGGTQEGDNAAKVKARVALLEYLNKI